MTRKTKIKAVIISIFFFALLTLPQLIYLPLRDYVDTENHENRVFQEFPGIPHSLSDLLQYPSLFESWFNDHLPFKNELVKFSKLFDIKIFGEVNSDTVLMGKDGWMFYLYSDGIEDSIADYRGTNHYTDEELAAFALYLDEAAEKTENAGAKLITLIIPNKEQVYSEYMPSTVIKVNDASRADLLYGYIRENSDTPFFYPLDEFRYAKDNWCQIYRKYDTHWNDMGAFIGARLLISAVNGEEFGPEDYMAYEIEDHGTFSGDLAEALDLQDVYNDDTFIKVKGYKEDVDIEIDFENETGTVTHYSSTADNDTRVLILRDSFGLHSAEYIAREYSDVTLIDYRIEDCTAAIKELAPDVVIIEAAERYLDHVFNILCDIAGADL